MKIETTSSSRVGNQIRGWLENEGYALVNTQAKGEPAPSWSFGVIFTPTPRSKSQVAVPIAIVGKDEVERVELILDTRLGEEHRKLMNEGTGYSQRATKTIREKLLLKGVGFTFVRDKDDQVVALRFDEVLYQDGVSRDGMMRSLRGLYSVFLYACDVLTELSRPGSAGFEPMP
ncbi:MAG TPA: DUF2299 family protein [Candidatus Thermoplasmatota archaeon]|nr:DUF2299 family protein [Candidatus Thermoplasmatota archaeon]